MITGAEMALLIFTPTWVLDDGRDAILPACREMIEAQQIAGPWTWSIGLENPFPISEHRNVLHQYQKAREMFLKGDPEGRPYEALLTVEHDHVLPDAGAVQRLMGTPGDVVYAPYVLRHGRFVLSTWQWINHRNLGMSLTNYPRELARARQAVIWKISGAGMGCTLFRRRALEAIPFAPSGARNPCPDLGFAEAALRAGFESFGRFDVPVWHWNGDRLLHPFEEFMMKKYIARETLNAVVCGRRVRFVAGREIELTEEEARQAERMGYLSAGPSLPIPVVERQPDEVSPPKEERGVIPPSRRNRAKTLGKDV